MRTGVEGGCIYQDMIFACPSTLTGWPFFHFAYYLLARTMLEKLSSMYF